MVSDETNGIADGHREWMRERYGEAWRGNTLTQLAREKPLREKVADLAVNTLLLIGILLAASLAILGSILFSPIILVLWPLLAGWEASSKYGYFKGKGKFGLKEVFTEAFAAERHRG